MEFLRWLLHNFGLFFGATFIMFFILMVRRLAVLYDFLRLVPGGEAATSLQVGEHKALAFLNDLFNRMRQVVAKGGRSVDPLIDAVWAELDCRISVHFAALNSYVNTLILVGFAGTIFGSIGAFNEMFTGLAQDREATKVFVAAWDSGLGTALYTSLGAAAIGGIFITIMFSRFFMTRAKRLETMVSLRIAEIVEQEDDHGTPST